MNMLRDFVYLDWERVRSLAAQLFQGVPETSTREHGSSLAVEGRVEGGVLNLLKGQAGVDYRYFRADNETRSFHHHVYNQVEDQLDQAKLITKVDSDFDFDGWTRYMFRDGQFVLVTGIVRLMDFGWVSAMMEALPKLMRAVHHSEDLSLKQLMEQGQLTQREFEARKKDQQRQLSDIQALKIDQLTTIVRQIYGNVVRVKVLPSRAHPVNVLVGTGDLPNFHDTEASLAQKAL